MYIANQKRRGQMKLLKYKKKRNLKTSPEPRAKIKKQKSDSLIFVIQEHHARQLHYDFRIEAEGVLKSWAVPKQPSLNPAVKRLAVQVEDHPYDYKDFEGTIPSGYGAGTVSIWDQGTYSVDGANAKQSEKLILEGLKKGAIHFTLEGKKLKGQFHLIQLKDAKKNQWLLIKKKEKEAATKEATLTHLDKILWPKEKITKGDLIQYYSKISSWILPYLKDRPESLRRFPNGIEATSFFQKNLENHPDWIETASIQHEKKEVHYLLIQNEESLLYAANLDCIELHPFFSRVQKLEKPDFLIFDLDPKGASFLKVIQVAQALHQVLEEFEVPSYCKTSGATGLHIAVPLGAKYTYEQAKQFAEIIALIVVQQMPKICTLERSIVKRKGKVYIDCQQNNLGQTLAAPYSVRARPHATVSTPLKWEEVKEGLDPTDYTIKSVFKRLKKWGDLYLPVLGKGIDLKTVLKNIDLTSKQ
jgi:DNA ligase D-like protein (predicted polymerase)/DNA ligase D-like protein (predicted 3'-phosphoesterase)